MICVTEVQPTFQNRAGVVLDKFQASVQFWSVLGWLEVSRLESFKFRFAKIAEAVLKVSVAVSDKVNFSE